MERGGIVEKVWWPINLACPKCKGRIELRGAYYCIEEEQYRYTFHCDKCDEEVRWEVSHVELKVLARMKAEEKKSLAIVAKKSADSVAEDDVGFLHNLGIDDPK